MRCPPEVPGRRRQKPFRKRWVRALPLSERWLERRCDGLQGNDQIAVEYNIRTRFLADQSAIEDVLAVEDDVVPFDRADVLGAGLR